MIEMVVLYLIVGLTWGIVLTKICLQEGKELNNAVKSIPAVTNGVIFVMLAVAVIFITVFWPIEAPVSVVKIIKTDMKKED